MSERVAEDRAGASLPRPSTQKRDWRSHTDAHIIVGAYSRLRVSNSEALAMRSLSLLILVAICACAGEVEIADEDRAACRNRGLAAETESYQACLKQTSDARYRRWLRQVDQYDFGG
jgi:hypothetical protein